MFYLPLKHSVNDRFSLLLSRGLNIAPIAFSLLSIEHLCLKLNLKNFKLFNFHILFWISLHMEKSTFQSLEGAGVILLIFINFVCSKWSSTSENSE